MIRVCLYYFAIDIANRTFSLNLQPHFTYHGFRYIEVSGFPNDLSKIIEAIRIDIPDMISSSFKTDNPLVNKLYKNIVRGQLGNINYIPTDCPQRDERKGWMADAQLFAPTAMYNGDMLAFYTKWLRDVREAQTSEGGYSDISPRYLILVCLQ